VLAGLEFLPPYGPALGPTDLGSPFKLGQNKVVDLTFLIIKVVSMFFLCLSFENSFLL